MDDYGFHLRDPVTGGYAWQDLLYPHWHGFFRPLHVMLVADLHTVFFHQPAVVHFVAAAGHGLATWMLYRVLVSLRLGPAPASAAAVLFLTYPAGYEVVLWPSACSASFSTALVLAAYLLTVRWAERRSSARALLLLFLAAFAAPCFYEQPASALGATPLLYLAAARNGENKVARLKNAAIVGMVAFSACALYIGIMVGTISHARGAAGSYVTLESLPERLSQVFTAAKYDLALDDFWPGALAEGARGLKRAPLMALLVLALLIAGARPWMRLFGRWTRREPVRPEIQPPSPGRPMIVLAAGSVVFLLAWLPVIAVASQGMASRLTYTPVLGLCIVLAAGLRIARDMWRRYEGDSPWPGVAVGAAALTVAVVSSVTMVGVQSVLRKRWQMDQRDCAALRSLVPDPPHNAVFMPLRLDHWPTQTGSPHFDRLAWSGWSLAACSTSMTRFAYGRADIASTESLPWIPYRLDSFDEAGLWYNGRAFLRPVSDTKNRQHVEWAALIPFTVDKNGRLKLVSQLRIDDGVNTVRFAVCPEVMASVARPNKRWFSLALDKEDAHNVSISGWVREGSNDPVALSKVGSGHDLRPAIAMHPPGLPGENYSAITTDIPPTAQPVRACFRVLLNPRASEGDGVEYSFHSPAISDKPLAVVRIRPTKTRRWTRIEFDIPPHDRPQALRVLVGPGEAGDTLCDWSFLTPGVMQVAPEGDGSPPHPAR